jgi:hypothetical protein
MPHRSVRRCRCSIPSANGFAYADSHHDLWHVLTGYGTDEFGEAALAFSYAQVPARANRCHDRRRRARFHRSGVLRALSLPGLAARRTHVFRLALRGSARPTACRSATRARIAPRCDRKACAINRRLSPSPSSCAFPSTGDPSKDGSPRRLRKIPTRLAARVRAQGRPDKTFAEGSRGAGTVRW